jgi:hypothetical protein
MKSNFCFSSLKLLFLANLTFHPHKKDQRANSRNPLSLRLPPPNDVLPLQSLVFPLHSLFSHSFLNLCLSLRASEVLRRAFYVSSSFEKRLLKCWWPMPNFQYQNVSENLSSSRLLKGLLSMGLKIRKKEDRKWWLGKHFKGKARPISRRCVDILLERSWKPNMSR